MSFWDEATVQDKHEKWSQWSMKPKKEPGKLTHLVAGGILGVSAIYVAVMVVV